MSAAKSIADQRMEAQVAQWLHEGPEVGPANGLNSTLAAAHGVAQRPRAMFPSAWLPRSIGDVVVARPHLGGVPILIILTLLLLLALATVYVGTRPHLPESLGPSRDNLVAFERDGHISVARVDGSGQRPISGDVPNAMSPVFSPDGTRVAFVSGRSSMDRSGPLYVASVVNSDAPIEVSHAVIVSGQPGYQVSWSPDGTQLAFTGTGIQTAIYVARADGTSVTALTDNTMNYDLPAWSTFWDGERIVYRAVELDGQRRHLEYMRPDGSDVLPLTTVIAPDASLSGVDWSPTNNVNTIQVSYTAGFGFGTPTQAMIGWVEAGRNPVTTWNDGVGGLDGYAPAWSPDGSHIAFITSSDGVVIAENTDNGGTIYNSMYDRAVIQLGKVAECWVDWSPDGTALYGGSPNGCTDTVVIPIDDPESAFITYTPMSGVTSWQPVRP